MSSLIDHYGSRDLASARAAELLGDALQRALDERDHATLVVSGGSTPQACLQLLAQRTLPWHRVLVTLTDERCVARDHPASNERMVREHLFTDRATTAQFVPLQHIAAEPFAAVLLGMGADGHFASLFPDAANLHEGLDLNNPRATIDVTTTQSPYPRISMTLPRLLNTQQLLLLAFGNDKRAILDQPAGYPVAALLQHQLPHPPHRKNPQHAPLQVLWAE